MAERAPFGELEETERGEGVEGEVGGVGGVCVVVSITKLNTKIQKKKQVITRAQGQEGNELTKFSIRN